MAAALLACAPDDVGAPARNLILISIDTLRADRLGAYGYERATSPALDALARRGTRFDVAVAESSWTLPSHVSLFTGLEPYVHGVNLPTLRVAADVPVLPEILRQHGFRTLAVTGGAFLSRRYGFERGFEFFPDAELRFGAALEVVERRLASIGSDERFFAFIHTYDVHCPYEPGAAYSERFHTPGAEAVESRGRCGNSHFNALALSRGQAAHLSDLYDAGIREADDRLGGFLERLDRAGRLDDTLVVVVSDHGEEFLEHGRIGHQATVYIEALRIPWIMAGPGVDAAVVSEEVGLADVLPTLLALLGIDDERADASLMRAGSHRERPPRISLNRWKGTLVSVVDGPMHAVYDKRDLSFRLFDWRADPTEQTDLAGNDPQRDHQLKLRMLGPVLHTRQPGPLHHERIEPPKAPDVERLRALGYVE
jgi:arylsulfatase A-like enzyme